MPIARHAGSSRAAGLRRDVGRLAAVLQHAVGRVGQGVHDYRTAGDVKLTKYFDGYSVGVGALVFAEHDFLSRGGSLDLRT